MKCAYQGILILSLTSHDALQKANAKREVSKHKGKIISMPYNEVCGIKEQSFSLLFHCLAPSRCLLKQTKHLKRK